MRILVAYASKQGGTEAIAQLIGEELQSVGHVVVVCPVSQHPPVSSFDAVILGSAVYFGQWRKEALEFGRHHASELKTRPVWLFDSGPLNESPDSGTNEPVAAADALASELGARGRTTFGGKLLESDAGFFTRRIMTSGKAGRFGDFRNLPRVRQWARKIGEELLATRPLVAP